MKHTYKQEVLDDIVDTIGQHVKTLKQHKGAIHELNIIIELSKAYERLNVVEEENTNTQIKGEI